MGVLSLATGRVSTSSLTEERLSVTVGLQELHQRLKNGDVVLCGEYEARDVGNLPSTIHSQ